MGRGLFRKLFILFWKNLVILKRQYIITACEIILPTLFAIALAFIRSQMEPYDGDSDSERPTYYDEWSEKDMVDRVRQSIYGYYYNNITSVVGFVPESIEGEEMISKFLKLLNEYAAPPYFANDTKVNITGFKTEAEMEAYQLASWSGNYYGSNKTLDYDFKFGVVFEENSDSKVSYKIRLPGYFYNTEDLFPWLSFPGPGSVYTEYYYSAFTGIQLLMDKVIMKDVTGAESTHEMSIQAFPYPPYRYFDVSDLYETMLPMFLAIGFVFVVPCVVRGVVAEKETGIKELMKMSGLPEWMHWFGWMLNSLIILIITITIIVIILFIPFNSTAGAVFQHSDPTLLWFILLLYSLWAISYCFTISAFFEKPTLATTAGIMIWVVSFYGLGFAMEETYGKNFSLGVRLLFCLFPNVAMHLSLKAYCAFESSEKGAKWGNIGDSINGTDPLTLAYPMLMFLASICVNMVICLYVEAVLPKKYGVRKPLTFIFHPSEWGFRGKNKNDLTYSQSLRETTQPGFEEEPVSIKPGVVLKKLRKEYGKAKVAVNDMSLKIYEGQIFCLLGENGAGKTTMMQVLTGLFAPTSGTAFINGYDIRTDMNKIRENLGLCPQHNMLFDKLTVFEHLKFFGMLKGQSAKAASLEADNLLNLLQFPEKKHALSMTLSGGQKRRLSLGCALIGGSKVVFLDEPTSGMDPEARRAIWDILLRLRSEQRVLVLTTHFMEEADVLGDRIAIMASGVLQCCGSPNFLKRFYGTGYTLSMTIKSGANRDAILNCVRGYVPEAHLKTSLSNSSTELSIVLPSESNTSAKFPDMFSELSKKQGELGINEIGVGWTTLDEVFIKVEELSHKAQNEDSWDSSSLENQSNGSNLQLDSSKKASGINLVLSQFQGLITKKLLYSIRRKRVVVSQILIPILLTIAAVSISGVMNTGGNRAPPLKMSISSYRDPVTLYSSTDPRLGNAYADVVGSSAKLIDERFDDVSEALLDAGRNDISYFRERHVIAAEINDTHTKAMYSTLAVHSPALSINVLTNALLRNARRPTTIEVTNHPFRNSFYELFEPAMNNSDMSLVIAFVFGVLVSVGLILLVTSFLIAPTEERLSNGKQLQMMTGVNPFLYWCSTLLCDYLLLIIAICLMTACLPIFESNKMFTNSNGAGILFLIMVIYGIATLSFSYIFSTFVRTVVGGFSLLIGVHMLTGIGFGIASFVIDNFVPGNAILVLNVIGRLFPSFGLTKATIGFAKTASNNGRCETLSSEAKEILCDPTFQPDGFYYDVPQECCDNCKELGDGTCFEPAPYFVWSTEVYDDDGNVFYIPGITQDIVWLGVISAVNFVILMLIEYDVFKMILEMLTSKQESDFKSTVGDDDVLAENKRVEDLVRSGRTPDNAIVVNNICKSYGRFSAVSKLSFGVHHGECFGLLGVNGAGKSTTFKMLTGDETRSNGNAYINNVSLENGRKKFLGQLGYCPQFDAIIGVLTGREMLSLFARLRGISGKDVEKESNKWLQRTGLLESGNVKCQKYSGGMKRRLSAAMALVGSPPVVLLDEPTSGVDPVARRQFWKIITSLKNSGQAIILTSHSMEECEALCSRLGIMVNGEMQCLGGVQHLKNKFVQGYSLTVKLKEVCLQNPELVKDVIDNISRIFNPCTLKDHHQTQMKFQIHSQSQKWEHLYRTMEGIKLHFQDYIEEYAITQTTLEEVFLSFARKQYVYERVTTGSRFNVSFSCC